MDDAPAAAGVDHHLTGRLGEPEGAIEVDLDDLAEVVLLEALGGRLVVDPGEVDQHVEATELLHAGRYESARARSVGEVDPQADRPATRARDLRGQRFRLLLRAPGDRDLRSVVGQEPARDLADAAVTAHQNHALPVEAEQRGEVGRALLVHLDGGAGRAGRTGGPGQAATLAGALAHPLLDHHPGTPGRT